MKSLPSEEITFLYKHPELRRWFLRVSFSKHCHTYISVFLRQAGSWKLSHSVGTKQQKISEALAYLREFTTGGKCCETKRGHLEATLRQWKRKGHLGPAVATLSFNFAPRACKGAFRHFAAHRGYFGHLAVGEYYRFLHWRVINYASWSFPGCHCRKPGKRRQHRDCQANTMKQEDQAVAWHMRPSTFRGAEQIFMLALRYGGRNHSIWW